MVGIQQEKHLHSQVDQTGLETRSTTNYGELRRMQMLATATPAAILEPWNPPSMAIPDEMKSSEHGDVA
jgi:hypothetical protein